MPAADRSRPGARRRLADGRAHLDPIRETYRRTGSVTDATGLTPARLRRRVPPVVRRAVRAGRPLAERTVLALWALPRRLTGATSEPRRPAAAPDRSSPSRASDPTTPNGAGRPMGGPLTVLTWGQERPPPPTTDVDVRWITLDRPTGATLALAVREAAGDRVGILAPTSDPVDGGWLAALAGHVHDDVVAATPLLVHPRRQLASATPDDGRSRELGLRVDVVDGAPQLVANQAGAPIVGGDPEPVDTVSAACVVADRRALLDALARAGSAAAIHQMWAAITDPKRPSPRTDAIDGIDAIDAVVADAVLELRLAGATVVGVPAVVVVDRRPVDRVAALRSPLPTRSAAWADIVARRGPALVRLRRPPTDGDGPSITITTAAPSEKVAPQWGDWHLAGALADSLGRLGSWARVATADHADDLASRSTDVRLVIRGLDPSTRSPGQRHVLWIISHPELVTDAELDDADLVLVASTTFAAELAGRTTAPVEVFLQATDHRRFRIRAPEPDLRHAVVVVAKTRDVMRPIVVDALAAGLRPTIFGSGWDAFVDPSLIAARHLPNDRVPIVYSSAGVLLNDHWDTMRRHGFVSNRIFDALACGAPIVSDHLPEIADLFGSAVATYRSVPELAATVGELLADPDTARERAAVGRLIVLAEHTMDHRARQLLDLLDLHDLR